MQNKSFSEYRKARFGRGVDKPIPRENPMFIRKLSNGGIPEWNKRAKAEYGKTIESPVDERALRDNVDLIQQSTTDPLLLKPKSKTDVDTLQAQLAEIPVKKDATKITVNKHGWADIESYRKKKDDAEFITNTQNFLSDEGWDITSDGVFGNKTYGAMNEYLVNKKLENYSGTHFTEDQFYDQIYKESHGKNNKVSPRGAIGLAQFMPSTFAWAKEKGWIPETAKITDPAAQSLAQRKYMDHLYEDIDNVASAGSNKEERQARAFAAYNHGPDNFNEFWGKLTKKQKEEGWETWYKLANDETQKYVLWMMDKSEYKRLYNTPETRTRKDGTTFKTSKWNDVYYGYENWRSKNHSYRYKYGGGVPKYNYGGSPTKVKSVDEIINWDNGSGSVHAIPIDNSKNHEIYSNAGYPVTHGDVLHIADVGNRDQNAYYIERAPAHSIDPITNKPTLPVSETDMTASTVDVSESADIAKTKEPKFHHRKFKEVDGKYYAYNPVMEKKGDGWYNITKNTWNHSIKDATLNSNTGEYEAWWHEGGLKDGHITNDSVLEYIRNNEMNKLVKGA